MYSYIILLITFSQLVVFYPHSSSGTDCDSTGYIMTPGIGAHNYHKNSLTWNEAREVCTNEGGHLAVIESEAEEKIITKYEADNNVLSMWVGYHEQFSKSDWVTVLDDPLDWIGFKHWRSGEPNNFNGVEHCIAYDTAGLNDRNCDTPLPFICKIDLS